MDGRNLTTAPADAEIIAWDASGDGTFTDDCGDIGEINVIDGESVTFSGWTPRYCDHTSVMMSRAQARAVGEALLRFAATGRLAPEGAAS